MSEQDLKQRFRPIQFRSIGDHRGWLTPLEEAKEIPFAVKRVYLIYGTSPEISRGFHAHRDLEQVAICVSGKCTFVVDDGARREKFVLNTPSQGLYMGSMVWREMHSFSSDCVLVVLASRLYNEADYIREYSDFQHAIQGGSHE